MSEEWCARKIEKIGRRDGMRVSWGEGMGGQNGMKRVEKEGVFEEDLRRIEMSDERRWIWRESSD